MTNHSSKIATSKAFAAWRKLEIEQNRKISIDDIIRETGLSKGTVRKFIKLDGDISQSPLYLLGVFSEYFGVPMCDLFEIRDAPAGASNGPGDDTGEPEDG